MSMTPCPGCGLPRVEDQVGTPCPVCAAGPAAVGPRPQPVEAARLDPTAGLPADAAELQRTAAGDAAFPRWLAAAAVFLVGSAAGVAATRGWQAAFPPPEVADDDRPPPVVVAAAPLLPQPVPPPRRVEVAPPPHEPTRVSPERELAPAPRAAAEPAPPLRVVTIDLNDPDLTYVLPSDLRRAPWVILRGKVKSLKITGLDGARVLDASGLEAGSVTVSGRIDHRATLKVNAPGGTVTVTGAVSGGSTVTITAPGGAVHFPRDTRSNRPGSQIDGGSSVAITARRVDLRGDVDGAGTRVTVTLTGDGWLWAEAVRGAAAVEYRTANGRGKPGASAGTVAPTATFQQRD